MTKTFYGAHESDDDTVAGYVGYVAPSDGRRPIETLVVIRTGATCDWTPELAAAFAGREDAS